MIDSPGRLQPDARRGVVAQRLHVALHGCHVLPHGPDAGVRDRMLPCARSGRRLPTAHARIRGVELACCCPWRAHSRVRVRRRTAAPPRPSELRHSGRRGCGRGRRCRADADRDAPGHRHRPGIRPAAGQAQIRRGDADRRGADPGPAARHQPLRRHHGRRPCGCRQSRHLMQPANTRAGGRQAASPAPGRVAQWAAALSSIRP